MTGPVGKLLPLQEEVRRCQNEHLRAWNEGDMETYLRYVSPEVYGFGVSGDLEDRARPFDSLRTLYDAGYKPNVTYRHRNLRIYAGTAVTTTYLVGTVTKPDGSVTEGVFRYSEARVKQDGIWKLVQYHLSPLTL